MVVDDAADAQNQMQQMVNIIPTCLRFHYVNLSPSPHVEEPPDIEVP